MNFFYLAALVASAFIGIVEDTIGKINMGACKTSLGADNKTLARTIEKQYVCILKNHS